MSNKTINDYPDNTSIDSINDKLLIYQNSTADYRKASRNTFLGITGNPADINSTQTISNKTLDNTNIITVKDTNFTMQDDGNITRQAKFQLSGITAGQTRTYTLPDASNTLVDTALVQTLTNKTLTAPTISNPTFSTAVSGVTLTAPTINGGTVNSATTVSAATGTFTNLITTGLTIDPTTHIPDWTQLPTVPTVTTQNGQKETVLTYAATDYTGVLQAGHKLKVPRTGSVPTQCTSLNGTTQYWNKTSPNGMTFTDDFVAGAWIYLTSYPTATVISRWNGTSGWTLDITSAGQVQLVGFNAAISNNNYVQSYQSIPLNKWTHVSAQLDMSTFTATTTTSYVMINGVDVPAAVSRSGTNPTSLIQAGNLEVGSRNGGTQFFPGKIASAFVSSAKITQANVRTLMSQTITASQISTHSIVSEIGRA